MDAKSPQIIDAFMYNGELEVLKFRLAHMNKLVDKTVIVESKWTFSGKEKTLCFKRDVAQIDPLLRKNILYFIIDENFKQWACSSEKQRPGAMPDGEIFQKNFILTHAIRTLNLKPFDYVIQSDLDEIPDRHLVYSDVSRGKVCVQYRPHWFNFSLSNYLGLWEWPSIWLYRYAYAVQEFSRKKDIRKIQGQDPPVVGGWHLSYFLSPSQILAKLRSYGHWDSNRDMDLSASGIGEITKRMKVGGEIFGSRDKRPFKFNMPPEAQSSLFELQPEPKIQETLIRDDKIWMIFVPPLSTKYRDVLPLHVARQWQRLNPGIALHVSLYRDCVSFLHTKYGESVVKVFNKLMRSRPGAQGGGAFAADLWRLCKLRTESGVYADIDIVPHLSLKSLDKSIDFHTCASVHANCVLQSFMMVQPGPGPKAILTAAIISLLSEIERRKDEAISWLVTDGGPTRNLYTVLADSMGHSPIPVNRTIHLSQAVARIRVGPSKTVSANINIGGWEPPPPYTLSIAAHPHSTTFNLELSGGLLRVTRTDKSSGWNTEHIVFVTFPTNTSFILYPECRPREGPCEKEYCVSANGKNIFDQRDEHYVQKTGPWRPVV